jgi:GntR family transcriptional regulator, transcriptional repressor for pyruvate dehydrogenase complex
MRLPTIERQTQLPARVANLITHEIEAGRLKPGDRLPTEQALATSLGVSRNVVREAIARLRSEGIVHSRQGVGAFLARTESATTWHIDAEQLKDQAEFQDLFELRAILEIRVAGLAAERHSPKDLRDFSAALARMRGSEKWEQGGVDADLDFHRAVAKASGNPYLVKVVSFISEQMRESIARTRERLKSVAEVMDVTIAEHTAIHEAIRDGSPAAARRAMSRHIRNAAARLGVQLLIDHKS